MFTLFLRILSLPILIGGLLVGFHFLPQQTFSQFVIPTALADDDEDEEDEDEDEDEEDEDEDEDEYETSSSTKTKTEIIETVEYQPVQRTVIVTDPAYATDSDGDELVDGLDPDPLVHQEKYFNDSDRDGVPDVFDRHFDRDDFTFVDDAEDANQNGLIDTYEESV